MSIIADTRTMWRAPTFQTAVDLTPQRIRDYRRAIDHSIAERDDDATTPSGMWFVLITDWISSSPTLFSLIPIRMAIHRNQSIRVQRNSIPAGTAARLDIALQVERRHLPDTELDGLRLDAAIRSSTWHEEPEPTTSVHVRTELLISSSAATEPWSEFQEEVL